MVGRQVQNWQVFLSCGLSNLQPEDHTFGGGTFGTPTKPFWLVLLYSYHLVFTSNCKDWLKVVSSCLHLPRVLRHPTPFPNPKKHDNLKKDRLAFYHHRFARFLIYFQTILPVSHFIDLILMHFGFINLHSVDIVMLQIALKGPKKYFFYLNKSIQFTHSGSNLSQKCFCCSFLLV